MATSRAMGQRSPPSTPSSLVFILATRAVWTGSGFLGTPRRRLGSGLLTVGSVYLLVMLLRYAVRMWLYPHERWTGGSIPIFFHWVLASWLLTLGHYHRTRAASAVRRRSVLRIAARATACRLWVLPACG